MQGHAFDFSYLITHLSFGKDENFQIIQRKFPDQGLMHPLNGYSEHAVYPTGADSKPKALMTNFYMIAVPSYYVDTNKNNY